MKFLVPVFVLLLSVGFYSCSKEKSFEIPDLVPEPVVTLEGKWNFIHVAIDMETYMTISEGGIRAESVTRYKDTSSDNSGGITIDASKITGKHVYTIDTYADTKLLLNGVETGGVPPTPLHVTVETEAFSAAYYKVNEDSLYLPQGAIFAAPSNPNNPSLPPSEPIGMKFNIKSDTLFFYANQIQDVQPVGGPSIKAKGKMVAVYKKQP